MSLRIVLATRNRHKATELRRILAEDPGLAGVTLLTADEVDTPEVDETGDTFLDNAMLKALGCADATGLACIADDSGLVVDALGGEPGVRSARYAGPEADDDRNLALVLERLRGSSDRAARFVCAAALVAPDGRAWTAEGVVEGHLINAPRGTGGFGYDPIFVPDGHDRTTAEMTPGEKDAISHRGRALRALRGHVRALLP